TPRTCPGPGGRLPAGLPHSRSAGRRSSFSLWAGVPNSLGPSMDEAIVGKVASPGNRAFGQQARLHPPPVEPLERVVETLGRAVLPQVVADQAFDPLRVID